MRLLKNRLGGRVGKISNFKLDPESLTVSDITFDTSYDMGLSSEEESNLGKLMKNIPNISADIDTEISEI